MRRSASSGSDTLSVELRSAFAQFRRAHPRHARPPGVRRSAPAQLDFALPPAPPSFDWRSRGVVTPSRSQLPGNSCASFAIAATIEADVRIAGETPVSIDPGFIHTCLVHQGIIDDPATDLNTPADILNALQAILANGLIEDTGEYPLPANRCPTLAGKIRIRDFVELGSRQDCQRAVASAGPVITEMYFYQNFFDVRGAGARYAPKPDSVGPQSHVVAIVGYTQDSWIIKNSFGAHWGDQGCAAIACGDCGIAGAPPPHCDQCRMYLIRI
jgi:hypothetical protein